MATWPGTLPQFVLQDGYREDLGDALLRSSMDTGPAKRRARFTAAPKELTVTIVMTSAEVDIFETFYVTTLGNGALKFTYFNPRTEAVEEVAFTRSPPPIVPDGPTTYLVTLPLEILP